MAAVAVWCRSAMLIMFSLTSTVPLATTFKHNSISGYYKLADRIQRKCIDGPLAVRARQANIVFTGTVRQVATSPPSFVVVHGTTEASTTTAAVEVKRIIKGHQQLYSVVKETSQRRPGVEIVGQNVDDQRRHHPFIVYVSGLGPAGSTVVCHGDVKVNDTWIFMVNVAAVSGRGNVRSSEVDVNLNSSLIRLSLNNIIDVEAAVSGKLLTPNATEQSEPCRRKICPFGAECLPDISSGGVSCQCVTRCSDVITGSDGTAGTPSSTGGPVCGTDDVTYESECELRAASCVRRRRIGVRWSGTCQLKDPCASKRCQFGARCIVADDGETVYCQCPSADECSPPTGTVCGDDGVDYASACHLNVTSCQRQKEITVKFTSKCNPCDGVSCPVDHVCVTNDAREPVCQCNSDVTICQSARYSPVCGTDWKTYPNECLLRVAACRQQIASTEVPIDVRWIGSCNGGDDTHSDVMVDSCEHVRCPFYATCQVSDEYDDAIVVGDVIEFEGGGADDENVRCVCTGDCREQPIDPVCGTDGVTYQNECLLQSMSCTSRLLIGVASRGPCGCHVVSDHVVLVNCPLLDEPICANDSVTYQNECAMRSAACNLGVDLLASHDGECVEDMDTEQSSGLEDMIRCDDTNCAFNGICTVANDELYRCVCQFECDDFARAEVCGSDGTLYGNDCLLREARCLMQTNIDILPLEQCVGDPLPPSRYDCSQSTHGCCSDGVTAALGPDMAGCPHVCRCNPVGSRSPQCHPESGQCPCKSGVGGRRCDRCRSGYWGLSKMDTGTTAGCQPCRCNPFGTIRDDCDQMTGRCVCRSHVVGNKCDVCNDGVTPVLSRDDCSSSSSSFIVASTAATGLESGYIARYYCGQGRHWTTMSTTVKLQQLIASSSSSSFSSSLSSSTHRLLHHHQHHHSTISGVLSTLATTQQPQQLSTASTTRTTVEPSTAIPHSDEFSVPSFSSRSYLQLKPLTHGQREVLIEMNFKTRTTNGIILYVGRQNVDKVGDFMSLSVKDGYVEFRYDLGSGPKVLRAREKVSLDKFNKVTAKRFGRDGVLRLNGGREVSGVSPGTLVELDAELPVYLGLPLNATSRTVKNVGIAEGFSGCIESLRIASPEVNKEYNLQMPGTEDIETAFGIAQCDILPCDKINCLNGGSCELNPDGSYGCQCIDSYSGTSCETMTIDRNTNHIQ